MKFIILNIIFSIFLLNMKVFAQTNCPENASSKTIVLFINLNFSYQEAEAAAAAACKRGDKFISYPDLNLTKKYGTLLNKFNDAEQKIYELNCGYSWEWGNPVGLSGKCLERYKTANTLRNNYSAIPKPTMNVEELYKIINSLDADKNILRSIVISGHASGYGLQGEQGLLTYSQLTAELEKYPEFSKYLNSIYLWGCYSGTIDKIMYWKSKFPDLQVYAGFYGAAPANIRPKSYDYLKDLLEHEDSLSLFTKDDELKNALLSVDKIRENFAAVYIDRCQGDDKYLSIQETGWGAIAGMKTEFGDFDPEKFCKEFSNTARSIGTQKIYNDFLKGFEDPPTETTGTPLRTAYSFSRQWQVCKEHGITDNLLRADHIGLLLFFNGVKANFDKVFEKERTEAFNELSKLDVNSIENQYDLLLQNKNKEIELYQNKVNHFSTNLADSLTNLQKESHYDTVVSDLNNAEKSLPKKLLEQLKDNYNENSIDAILGEKGKRKQDKATRYLELRKKKYEIEANVESLRTRLNNDNEINKGTLQTLQSEKLSIENEKTNQISNINQLKNSISDIDKITFKNKRRGEILSQINTINNLIGKTSNSKISSNLHLSKTEKFAKLSKQYLVDLDEKCMDMLDWHEAKDGHTPRPLCE